jgi:hypothetical protein
VNNTSLSQSRLVVGLILIAAAVLMLILGEGAFATAGAVAIGILGLISVAISRRG